MTSDLTRPGPRPGLKVLALLKYFFELLGSLWVTFWSTFQLPEALWEHFGFIFSVRKRTGAPMVTQRAPKGR